MTPINTNTSSLSHITTNQQYKLQHNIIILEKEFKVWSIENFIFWLDWNLLEGMFCKWKKHWQMQEALSASELDISCSVLTHPAHSSLPDSFNKILLAQHVRKIEL